MLGTGRGILLAAGLAGAALAIAGCGGSSGTAQAKRPAMPAKAQAAPPQAEPDSGQATITIQGSGFGAPQTVNPGEPVILVNNGSAACTLRSGSVLKVQVGPGAKVTFTAPTEPGAYPLSCGLSPDLHGTLNVRGV